MRWYSNRNLTSWSKIQETADNISSRSGSVVFRGQSQDKDLSSSLERTAIQYGRKLGTLPVIEGNLLREFKRSFHRYNTDVPCDDKALEWLSIMQHHGSPTRLLDATYSFYIALFFALEKKNANEPAIVWMFDIKWMWDRVHAVIPAELSTRIKGDQLWGKSPDIVSDILGSECQCICPLVPFRLGERLSVQQGVFLAPLDVREAFIDNLISMDVSSSLRGAITKYKVKLSHRGLRTVLDQLNSMNVNRAALFPGIDGFASGLATKVALHLGEVQPHAGQPPNKRLHPTSGFAARR